MFKKKSTNNKLMVCVCVAKELNRKAVVVGIVESKVEGALLLQVLIEVSSFDQINFALVDRHHEHVLILNHHYNNDQIRYSLFKLMANGLITPRTSKYR